MTSHSNGPTPVCSPTSASLTKTRARWCTPPNFSITRSPAQDEGTSTVRRYQARSSQAAATPDAGDSQGNGTMTDSR